MRTEVRPVPALEPKAAAMIDALTGILPVRVVERKLLRTRTSTLIEGDEDAMTEFISHILVTIPVRDGERPDDAIIFNGGERDGIVVARHREGYWGMSIRGGSESGEPDRRYYFDLLALVRAILAKRHGPEGYPSLGEARSAVRGTELRA